MITVGTVGHYLFWGCLYAMAGVGILATGSLFIVCVRVIESSGFLSFKSLPPRYGKMEAERMAQERALQKKESKSRGSSFSSSSSKKSKSKSAPVSPEGKSVDVEGYTGNAEESKADRYLNNSTEPLEPEGGEDYEMAKTPKSMKKEEEKDTLFEGEGFRLEKGEGEGVPECTV